MSAVIINTRDAMILGMAARYPRIAKKYLDDLSPALQAAGTILATGVATKEEYDANKGIVKSVLRSSNPKRKVNVRESGSKPSVGKAPVSGVK
jgi:hypothetical protein